MIKLRMYKTVLVFCICVCEIAAQDSSPTTQPETTDSEPDTAAHLNVSSPAEWSTTDSYQMFNGSGYINGLIRQTLNAGERFPFLRKTRRIISGHESGSTKSYMVYLRAAAGNERVPKSWLCGGSIVDEMHILTSAACIENVEQFFVVSGTHRYIHPDADDDCMTYGAKRAVWKCTPKSYVFDGEEMDNLRWMASDIAVVKVEDAFNFQRRVRGCDFIPTSIGYNNESATLERPWVFGTVSGWGSTETFSEDDVQQDAQVLEVTTPKVETTTEAVRAPTETTVEPGVTPAAPAAPAAPTTHAGARSKGEAQVALNSDTLLETEVVIIPKTNCKRVWPKRYHYIIIDSLICSQDAVSNDISVACLEQGLVCKEIMYDEAETTGARRAFLPDFGAAQTRRGFQAGGFCENDHGGPLVVGQGRNAKVVGIISACMVKDVSRKCYGPFLYTSVWHHRHLIDCAINKDIAPSCRRLMRSGSVNEKVLVWPENMSLRRGNNTGSMHRTVKQKTKTPRRPSPRPPTSASTSTFAPRPLLRLHKRNKPIK